MYKIIFTESYEKKAMKFFKKHSELKNQYEKCLELLESNPFHPSLRLHVLKGSLTGIFSVSINLAYRIIIDFIIEEETITPIYVGSHDEIYEK